MTNAVNSEPPILRDYQEICIDACMRAVSEGRKRIGVSLATGGGKTVIFSNLVDKFRKQNGGKGKPSLILVHRRELALQAARTIHKFFPDLNIQVEMGNLRASLEEADVVIGSVLSMVRRVESYEKDSIGLIIIDEAHHSVAKSYIKVLEHFGADSPASPIPVIGFSATFERLDKKALSRVMDEIVYHRGILEMIDDQWLCEGKFTTVGIETDLTKVKTVGSDFQIGGLSKAINTKETNEIVLKTYLHMRSKHKLRSTLLFGVDVAHCKSLFELFQEKGINAQYVTGKTRLSERDDIVSDFKEGRIEVLMNCGIFTEGTDLPNVDCILLCRPTKSRSLLVQMIGRGLRLHHNKEHCQIIDFVSSSKVGVVSVPTLVGLESYAANLDEATLDELSKLKEEMELQAQEQERREAKIVSEEQSLKKKYENILKSSNSLELTLTNFRDFKSFCAGFSGDPSKMSDATMEYKMFAGSSFPWVKVSSSSWCFPLRLNRHLRIDREKDGTNKIYVLKLYRRIPRNLNEVRAIKFAVSEAFRSHELVDVMNTAEAIVSRISEDSSINLTKFAPWRQYLATPKQRTTIERIMKRVLAGTDSKFSVDEENISDYVRNLSKGDSASILFAVSIAPKFPIFQILKILSMQKNLGK